MKETLVVNLYGGPGCGKSTGAAYLFSKLKMAGVDAEYVTEFAKDKVWESNQEAFKCQFYISGKQVFKISRCFGKVDVIITDSPIMLGKVYADRNGLPLLGNACVEAARKYENNTLNVILQRVKPYNQNGRNQSEDEAKNIDAVIRNMLGYYKMKTSQATGDAKGYDEVFNMIMNTLRIRKLDAEKAKATPDPDNVTFMDFPARKVVHKGIYRHFKGKYYIVEDVAKHSETGEQMVVYRHLYGDRSLCVRPLKMFLSEEHHDKYQDDKHKNRIELVEDFKEETSDQP